MRTFDLIIIAMFVALMAVASNITSFFPFLVIFGVPVTFQTFMAILTGAVLGSKRGAWAMTVYALVGLLGALYLHSSMVDQGCLFAQPLVSFCLLSLLLLSSERSLNEKLNRRSNVCCC